MRKARTTYEAAQMADATMKGVNNPWVWDVCFKAFEAGLSQKQVNEVLRDMPKAQKYLRSKPKF